MGNRELIKKIIIKIEFALENELENLKYTFNKISKTLVTIDIKHNVNAI